MNNIKQALESAIEVIHKNTHLRDKEATDAINACKAALTKLDKCEPVAWYLKKEHTGKVFFHKDEVDWCIENEGYAIEQLLYTSPQPRDWVGLSDTAWMNIVNHDHAYESMNKEDAVHYAVKATEAKLKQLNMKG